MNNDSTSFILGFLLGLLFSTMIVTIFSNNFSDKASAIQKCELELPRNQKCEAMVTAVVIDKNNN